jgi:hypothetical protein
MATYGDSVPSVVGSRVHAGLPQLRFLADSATAAHTSGVWGRYDAREDRLFDAASKAATEDEGPEDNS